jgi:outer membrane protein TolC
MNAYLCCILFAVSASLASAQTDSLVLPEPRTLDLPTLISEALEHNPTIRKAQEEMNAMDARATRAGPIAPPELIYRRDEMPDFRFSEARYNRWELMQMIMFPTKLSAMRSMAEIEAEHAHHDHLEIINDVVAQVADAYTMLWFTQQRIVLEQENIRLMKQVAAVSGSRYAAGIVPQYDVLKAQMELAMLSNSAIALREKELNAKEMLMALLARDKADTLGFAVISEAIPVLLPLDSLERTALAVRPMLIHDSMMVVEATLGQSLSRQALLPDLRLGVEYMTSPMDEMRSWSVSVGVTLPFAPWSLGIARSEREEADARLRKATAGYEEARTMLLAEVRTKYREAESERRQLATFRDALVPQSEQTLESVLTAYQNGRSEFMMVLESYRTVTNMTVEYFMTRMRFEQSVVALQRAVGSRTVSVEPEEEVKP